MANDVNDDANRLSSGTTQQAASIEEISVTINQVSTQVIENEKMVSKVNDNARKSVLDAMESNKLMSEMTTAMTEIQNSSQSIQKVLKMINDIAFQTNILSLNAAVEAARAGQHGKGFAVIAEDVRNLAMKSATAADDTNIMLEEIINKVNLGKELSEDTAKSLKNILNGNEQNSRMMSEVAKATDEQKQSMTQISKSINEVSDGVNISSANANKSSLTAQSLEIQSKELLDLVSKFTLKNNT
jgi:methyl-accepting chemotaxis protein